MFRTRATTYRSFYPLLVRFWPTPIKLDYQPLAPSVISSPPLDALQLWKKRLAKISLPAPGALGHLLTSSRCSSTLEIASSRDSFTSPLCHPRTSLHLLPVGFQICKTTP